ncbi:GTP-binding protein REM 1-like [Stigmatopora nigra]
MSVKIQREKDVPSGWDRHPQRAHPPLGQSASYQPGVKPPRYRAQWSSDSDADDDDCRADSDGVYRLVLVGDRGVGKSSLAAILAGLSEKDEQPGEETYERTLTVDGEEAALVVTDTWTDQQTDGEVCPTPGDAYVIVYAVSDRRSFDVAAELGGALRGRRQADDISVILVGNKSDLVRSREVGVEEGRACAAALDCKFIETSAALQHNVSQLLEGAVRQIRRGRRPPSSLLHRESLAQKARRFLDRLVARHRRHPRLAVKVRSKSCHDLGVL